MNDVSEDEYEFPKENKPNNSVLIGNCKCKCVKTHMYIHSCDSSCCDSCVSSSNNISTNNEPLSLNAIYALRDNTFNNEYNELPFTLTTTILYKAPNESEYTLYPVFQLSKYKIVIFKFKSGQTVSTVTNAKQKKYHQIPTTHSSSTTFKDTQYQHINKYIVDYNHPILFLNLNLLSCCYSINQHSLSFELHVLSSPHVITFQFRVPYNNNTIYQQIITLLRYLITGSRGYRANIMGVAIRSNFYKQFYMSEVEFQYKAKTGDVLIFRGYDCYSKLQRCLTRSQYDHVGIVIKSNGVLFVYDATMVEGCKRKLWRDFVLYAWYLMYEKVVFRELCVVGVSKEKKEETEQIVNKKCEEFYLQTCGRDYYMHCSSIACDNNSIASSSVRNGRKETLIKSNKGFTCSALVSAAYYHMGILNVNVDSVLPGDYAQDESKLTFNKPFELGPEYVIDFTK
jgi:hypothetical protein